MNENEDENKETESLKSKG